MKRKNGQIIIVEGKAREYRKVILTHPAGQDLQNKMSDQECDEWVFKNYLPTIKNEVVVTGVCQGRTNNGRRILQVDLYEIIGGN